MSHLPIELVAVSDETTIIGDIDLFMEYVENGQALRDWHERLASIQEECEAFLREHSHVWSHIVIQTSQLAA
jgi:hypothetical protein